MPRYRSRSPRTVNKINRVEITEDLLSSRAGLTFFRRYLQATGISSEAQTIFGRLRKNRKGASAQSLFEQILSFFVDGTSSSLVHFDRLRRDPGHAAVLEMSENALVSSHTVKRFVKAMNAACSWSMRRLLRQLFVWRLRKEQPQVIVLGIDTMIMDNSESSVRQGVEPTYRRGVKGFQPLQISWGPYMVDAVFRGGSKHSNHGDTVFKSVQRLVNLIRRTYGDVPIMVRMDAGFFDGSLMKRLENMGIAYMIGGKLYDDLLEQVESAKEEDFYKIGEKPGWQVLEMRDCRNRWKKYRRALFSQTVADEKGQLKLGFATTRSIFYTNLAYWTPVGKRWKAEGLGSWLGTETLLNLYHNRGKDELVHRAYKEFTTEELPFKRFHMNMAW